MRMATRVRLVVLVFAIATITLVVGTSYAQSGAAVKCPGDFNASTASVAVLAACHVASYHISSVAKLPDGGTMTNYGSSHVANLVPPSGFDPATASDTELARYAIPAEPPASDPLRGRHG